MTNLRYADFCHQDGNQVIILHADFTAEEAAAFELMAPAIFVTFRDGEVMETTLCDEGVPVDCRFTDEELNAIHMVAIQALDEDCRIKTTAMSRDEFHRQMQARLTPLDPSDLAQWDAYVQEMILPGPGGRTEGYMYAELFDGLMGVDWVYGRELMRRIFEFPAHTDGFCLHMLEMLGAAEHFQNGLDYPAVYEKIREEDFEVRAPYHHDDPPQPGNSSGDRTKASAEGHMQQI